MSPGQPDIHRRQAKLNPWGFAYATLTVLFFAGFLIRMATEMLAGTHFVHVEAGQLYVSDFVCFYQAGKMAASAEPWRSFEYDYQLGWLNRLIAPYEADKVFSIPAVPFFYLLMVPFSWLSLDASYVLWLAVSLAAGLGGLWLLLRTNGSLAARRDRLVFLSGVLATLASVTTLQLGQITWLLVGAVAAFYWSWLRRRSLVGGVALAVSTLKPQFAVFLALPALLDRRWRLIGIAVAAEALLLLLSGLNLGWENISAYPAYLSDVSTSDRYWGIYPRNQVNLRAALSWLLGAREAFAAGFAVYGASIVAAGAAWLAALRRRSELVPWAMALSLAVAMVASPHLHHGDTLLLAVAAGLTLQTVSPAVALSHAPASRKLWELLLLYYPLVGFLTFAFWDYIGWFRYGITMLMNLALLAAGVWYFLTNVRERGPASTE